MPYYKIHDGKKIENKEEIKKLDEVSNYGREDKDVDRDNQ